MKAIIIIILVILINRIVTNACLTMASATQLPKVDSCPGGGGGVVVVGGGGDNHHHRRKTRFEP